MEAEMAGLDDAGMDGADGDLMQLGAVGGEKGVVGSGALRRRRSLARPRGERVNDRPVAVIEPRPPVERAERDMAEEVEDGALEPDRARPHGADRGEAAALAGQRGDGDAPIRLLGQV